MSTEAKLIVGLLDDEEELFPEFRRGYAQYSWGNGPGVRNGPQACMDFLKEFVDDNESSARYADDLSLLGKAARKVSE